ncbi:protein kinase, putative [Entamoeba histolytica HM-1:IMSS-B]|uniref:Protein kinase, putative n=6 Tax=Entamoeba histolytica TaxID=5759 RepID=C4LWU9_ENTH1|nr:protein kinase, putative [Entamoeba histolytica HM-1:IMSS]EMD43539.1 serine/threonine protein kinase cds1, putative [Entamoeba histolytica KU27]EMH74654.1 protein kinase, putative [Entamoeba histolytica HM-1:IMSS-B]EMS16256.1 serine/threonine protein kinase, putative [Entamoeba histolytica HM-3:IMSS]ENY63198.1 serine/threonine protein kinase cds1, putative [Entamoeba histolytica HM-1:IMSS-A]GAT93192.1 protein kinase putative [Entamoeba histolytica]|eukprot:XP_653286.1 protein kinase, putative [Entamoeba histolytica HM-1:IMSS]
MEFAETQTCTQACTQECTQNCTQVDAPTQKLRKPSVWATLRADDGGVITVLQLSKDKYTIGRSGNNDVIISNNVSCSRKQCSIRRTDDGEIFFEDESSNGTMVNGTLEHNNSTVVTLPCELCIGSKLKTYIFIDNEVVSFSEKYSIIKTLGQGTTAKVILYKEKGFENEESDEHSVAVKVIDKKNKAISEEVMKPILEEVETLKKLQHQYVVKVNGMYNHETTMYIVMEYVSGGSLQQLIENERSKKIKNSDEKDQVFGLIELNRCRKLFGQIMIALEYVHDNGIIHRDIKPDNILLTKDGNAKLADFGIAKKATIEGCSTFVGTLDYLAPEISTSNSYDQASDIWSCGVMLYNMLFLFPFKKPKNMYELQITDDTPLEIELLLRCILQENPISRPNAAQILHYTFLLPILSELHYQTKSIYVSQNAMEECPFTQREEKFNTIYPEQQTSSIVSYGNEFLSKPAHTNDSFECPYSKKIKDPNERARRKTKPLLEEDDQFIHKKKKTSLLNIFHDNKKKHGFSPRSSTSTVVDTGMDEIQFDHFKTFQQNELSDPSFIQPFSKEEIEKTPVLSMNEQIEENSFSLKSFQTTIDNISEIGLSNDTRLFQGL